MAFALDDRVKETSTTTGTGTYNLDGAVTGFQTFVAGIGNGNTTWYCATDGTNWEIGIGTVTDATPDTLARTTVLSSSNADAAVNWGAGTKQIGCVQPASRAFYDAGTAGQIPQSSGSGGPITWRTPPAGYSSVNVYTATGAGAGNVWSKPTGLQFVIVECVGGGGGGAGAVSNLTSGSGGGAGGYCRRAIAAASLSATEQASVGGGGTQGTSGGAGGAGTSTTFGAFMTACGGAPGVTGGALSGGLGGSGGLATSGDFNVQGGDGGNAASLGIVICGAAAGSHQFGGYGGASFFGGGASDRIHGATGGAAVGFNGKAFGSGGGGGIGSSGAGASGGAGANGIVIVWNYV